MFVCFLILFSQDLQLIITLNDDEQSVRAISCFGEVTKTSNALHKELMWR